MKTSTSQSGFAALALSFLIGVSALLAYWVWSQGTDSNHMTVNENIVMTGKYTVRVSIEPNPPRVGRNTVNVYVMDKSKQPVSNAIVRAVAQMPAMGSMPPMNAAAEISESTPGTYTGEFELSMSGEWPLAIDIESEQLGHGDITFDMATGRSGLSLATATPEDISHYTCSMHPSVKSAVPGTCPICSMNLVPVTKQEMQSGSIRVDAKRRQLIGVTTGIVEEKTLSQTIRAAGRITFDETRLTGVTLKFDAWIGKLNADYIGAPVNRGEPLFTVYSPELLSTQQEYLETLARRKKQNDSLLVAARQRLRLWDISPGQIRQLEKRGKPGEYLPINAPANGVVIEKTIVAGSAVKAGQKLMRIANLDKVWVEAQIYEYEIPQVKTGMTAKVTLPDLDGRTLSGKVTYIYPFLEGDTRTAKIRIELDNENGELRPDMYTQVLLKTNLGLRLVVPEGAVLYAGDSRVVFIDKGNGQLQPRKIRTGLRNGDHIEVLDGLSAGDRVVTSGNFLIAAESKLKAGIDQW